LGWMRQEIYTKFWLENLTRKELFWDLDFTRIVLHRICYNRTVNKLKLFSSFHLWMSQVSLSCGFIVNKVFVGYVTFLSLCMCEAFNSLVFLLIWIFFSSSVISALWLRFK
jgi:hypothetical protein